LVESADESAHRTIESSEELCHFGLPSALAEQPGVQKQELAIAGREAPAQVLGELSSRRDPTFGRCAPGLFVFFCRAPNCLVVLDVSSRSSAITDGGRRSRGWQPIDVEGEVDLFEARPDRPFVEETPIRAEEHQPPRNAARTPRKSHVERAPSP
jgi:hypothetical protein